VATEPDLWGQGHRLLRKITKIYPHLYCFQRFQGSPLPLVQVKPITHQPIVSPVWSGPCGLPQALSLPDLIYPHIHPPNISQRLLDEIYFASTMAWKAALNHFSSWLTFVHSSRLNHGVTSLGKVLRQSWAGWAAPPGYLQASLPIFLSGICVRLLPACLASSAHGYRCVKVTWNEDIQSAPGPLHGQPSLPLHLLHCFSFLGFYFK